MNYNKAFNKIIVGTGSFLACPAKCFSWVCFSHRLTIYNLCKVARFSLDDKYIRCKSNSFCISLEHETLGTCSLN